MHNTIFFFPRQKQNFRRLLEAPTISRPRNESAQPPLGMRRTLPCLSSLPFVQSHRRWPAPIFRLLRLDAICNSLHNKCMVAGLTGSSEQIQDSVVHMCSIRSMLPLAMYVRNATRSGFSALLHMCIPYFGNEQKLKSFLES